MADKDWSTIMLTKDELNTLHMEKLNSFSRVEIAEWVHCLRAKDMVRLAKLLVEAVGKQKAMEIYRGLQCCYDCIYDDSGSIGKRYYRQDEIGTSFCITVDHQTIEDGTVTVRDRDSTKQERVRVDSLHEYLHKKMK